MQSETVTSGNLPLGNFPSEPKGTSSNLAAVKAQIAEILNIPNSPEWKIVDSREDKNLYLIHYERDADMTRFGDLRGIAVDLAARAVVSRAFGYTPTAVADTIRSGSDGQIHLEDEHGNSHVLNPADFQAMTGFEATVIMMFKHAGVVYRRTHRRLDPVNSRWGKSKSFAEMGVELGLPADDVLFNPKSAYSPYCHIFLMVHPDILVSTKAPIGPGFLVYRGALPMWSVEEDKCPYKQTGPEGEMPPGFAEDPRPNAGWIDSALYLPNTVQELPLPPVKPVLYNAPFLDMKQAEQHLQRGFYSQVEVPASDPRLGLGEFVMVHKRDSSGRITGLLRVVSTAYHWRETMRGNEPNLKLQMFRLMNGSYIKAESKDGLANYKELYPIISPVLREKDVRPQIPILTWPLLLAENALRCDKKKSVLCKEDPDVVLTKDDRYYNLALAFMMAVPLHRQKEALDMYDVAIVKRGEVVKWLRELADMEDLGALEVPERAKNIISTAQRWALDSGQRNVRFARDGNIRNLVNKEEGASLYRLARAMDEYYREEEAVVE
jgi:hypothetical protein